VCTRLQLVSLSAISFQSGMKRLMSLTILATILALFWAALINYFITRSEFLIYIGFYSLLALAALELVSLWKEIIPEELTANLAYAAVPAAFSMSIAAITIAVLALSGMITLSDELCKVVGLGGDISWLTGALALEVKSLVEQNRG